MVDKKGIVETLKELGRVVIAGVAAFVLTTLIEFLPALENAVGDKFAWVVLVVGVLVRAADKAIHSSNTKNPGFLLN